MPAGTVGPRLPESFGFLVTQQPQDRNTACYLPVPPDNHGVKGTKILKGHFLKSAMGSVEYGVKRGHTTHLCCGKSAWWKPWEEVSDRRGSACRSLRVLVMWVCGTLMVQAVFPVEVGGPVMLQAGPLRMEGH